MKPIDPEKFIDPHFTRSGEPRAVVGFVALKTLWFNTGTLCNLTCVNCYIESSPTNNRLSYLSCADVVQFLDEIPAPEGIEIGYTGGEPFMNPAFIEILEETLRRGFRTLVLTNAMRPMAKCKAALLLLQHRYPGQLHLRVSLDHYEAARHESERGPRSFKPTLDGMRWLNDNRFSLSVAGRTYWGESDTVARAGYAALFSLHGIHVAANDPTALVLFPEMDARADTPEISVGCWDILKKSPNEQMCASSRMVVKRRGQAPSVAACTLLPYETDFDLGPTLLGSMRPVALNHPHCSRFCVLGGGSCSAS